MKKVIFNVDVLCTDDIVCTEVWSLRFTGFLLQSLPEATAVQSKGWGKGKYIRSSLKIYRQNQRQADAEQVWRAMNATKQAGDREELTGYV